MKSFQVLNLGGLNQYTNPLIKGNGELIHSVNVDSYPLGGKTKRSGYIDYLGTADGSAVTSLFSCEFNGSIFAYRASGSSLYYSVGGTGAWTLAGNGTISPGSYVGYAVLGNTLILGDGVGSTRHTTNGTSFTNTTLAPVSNQFAQYQNRVYACGVGTSNNYLFYSTSNDATNWNLSGTADSSSLTIPGEGYLSKVINSFDRLVIMKTSGKILKWDGYSLIDSASNSGARSYRSVATKESLVMWLNGNGVYGYSGGLPQLMSNAIQGQIYNRNGNGISATDLLNAPATFSRNSYLVGVGTVTPDITNYQIPNALINYDLQKNTYDNYSFYHKPTAMHTFIDATGKEVTIFGTDTGQCYKLSGTATSDAGYPISSMIELCIATEDATNIKEFSRFRAVFNPGSNAKVRIAVSNSFSTEKRWTDIGDAENGIYRYAFPNDSRGQLLFINIYESSITAPYSFYGIGVDYNVIPN